MKRLKVLCVSLLMSAAIIGAQAQGLMRSATANDGAGRPYVPEGLSHYKGASAGGFVTTSLMQVAQGRVSTSQVTPPLSPAKSPLMRANAAGAIKGYLGFHQSLTGTPTGWYTVGVPTSKLVWGKANYYPSSGFVRNGVLTTFYSRTSTSDGLYAMGRQDFDVTKGTLISEETYNVFDQKDRLVWGCAYDRDADLVYMITSRQTDGNKYQAVVYNPNTATYTRLGDVANTDFPIAMNWSPEDGGVYILLESGVLKRMNKTTGAFTVAANSGHQISDYSGAMVYSPKDKGFVYIVSNYDDESKAEVGVISLTGTQKTLGLTTYDEQWIVLHTDDPYAAAEAPAPAKLASWDFNGASLSGSVKLTMPTVTNDGAALTADMFLQVTVDGDAPVYDSKVAAGATVDVPLTLTEGAHRLSVRPYVYSGINKVYAADLRLDRYAGNDTPLAPAAVTLSKTNVSWTAPGAVGANGGYVETAALRYNVYLNGALFNATPVSGTSLDITLPAGAPLCTAEVEAIANGKTSARTASAPLAVNQALTVPCYLGPAEGQRDMVQELIDLFTFVDDNRDNKYWQYDRQNPYTGGFYYLNTNDQAPADDWLILPAINFDSTDDVYTFSFEAWASDHYFSSEERFEVGISPDLSTRNMTIIHGPQVLPAKASNFTPVDVKFQVAEPGVKYLGIRCISDPNTYRLYARRFLVTRAAGSLAAPAAVTDINIAPAPDGQRSARVDFKMPVVDLKGNTLPEGMQITAKVSTTIESKSVTAAAGANASVEIKAAQGVNTFVIVTSSENGEGASVSTESNVGVDLPGLVTITKTVSEDNLTMVMNWEASTIGSAGGPVIPSECTYKLMRHNGQNWMEYADLGSATTYTYTVPAGAQKIVQLGILAVNGAGEAPSFATCSETLGTPYGLPMNETWPAQGENVTPVYDPYQIQSLTELAPKWGFVDPADLSDKGVTPNASGNALVAYWVGSSRIYIPKFTTKGMNNVKFDFSAFFGAVSPTKFMISGSSNTSKRMLLGEYRQSDGDGWTSITVDLPTSLQNQDWVQLDIEVDIASYSQYLLIENYSIKNHADNDLSVSWLKGDANGNAGKPLAFKAAVRNLGSTTADMPIATVKLIRDGETLEQLSLRYAGEQIPDREEAEYHFTITPTNKLLGKATMQFAIESMDADLTNNVMEMPVHFHVANIPVPQGATVTAQENGALIAWEEPAIVFGAEENIGGEYGENIGLFTNLDRDGLVPYALTGINYADRLAPKGFQVLDVEAIKALVPLIEGAGDRVLFTMASGKGVQDNWLISPEVKAGSDVRFRIACASPCDDKEYLTEHIQLLASSTTNQPEAFTLVKDFSSKTVRWTDCAASLPEDAKYFAFRYTGEIKNFCLFIDNIAYYPAQLDGSVKGYNVYRNDEATPTLALETTWVDAAYNPERPAAWVVRTLMNINGEDFESVATPQLVLNATGIDATIDVPAAAVGARGYIELRSMNGREVTIATLDGRIAWHAVANADVQRIEATPGFYIVASNKDTFKVVVK